MSPLAPIGVSAALDPTASSSNPRPKIFEEFSLKDRVGIVSGGNRGLGLEMALVLCEQGARAIYCFDLPAVPSAEWRATSEYVHKMSAGASRLEYVSVDVRDQGAVWAKGEEIGDKEERMDVCVAAAGILRAHTGCLEYPAEQFEEVQYFDLFSWILGDRLGVPGDGCEREWSPVHCPSRGAADVALREQGQHHLGRFYVWKHHQQGMFCFTYQHLRILICILQDHAWVSYNSSKSAVLQMARSMACELGKKNIRVNSLSPGHISTAWVSLPDTVGSVSKCLFFNRMTAQYLDKEPHTLEKWSNLNPMGRIGRPDELRGVVAWLASDASSFCTGSE